MTHLRGECTARGQRLLVVLSVWLCGSALAQTPTPNADEPVRPAVVTADTVQLQTVALAGVEAQGAALLLSGQSGGTVFGALTWTATEISEHDTLTTVSILVDVDGRSLLAESTVARTPVEIYGYLVDDAGAVVGHLAQGVVLEGEAARTAVTEAGLRFVAELRLMPGLYSLRVLIRNHTSGAFFLARRDLEVPGAASLGPLLLPPLIPASPPAPVVVGHHSPDNPSRLSALPGLQTWPAARPVIGNNRPVDLVLVCSPFDDSVAVSTRLVNAVGRAVDEPRLEVSQPVWSLGVVAFHRATLSPVDVPEGHYRLVVELSDSDSGRTVSKSLEIAVGLGEEFSKWAEQEAVPPPMPPGEKSGKKLHPRSMKMAYQEALQLLADGAAAEARRTLAELERQIVATGSPRQWMQLREVEWGTALELSRSHPASLMAVALLHREMYHWYAARYEFELSEHSWTLAAAIAEQTSRFDARHHPEDFVKALLLDLATDLAQRGSVRRAQTLFEQAFEIAPRDEPVLFGLALIHEFAGEWYDAVQYLQRLVDDRPDHYEARLRLGINRGRLGADRKAEELLRALLVKPAPAWIQTIAYQELTRLLLEHDRIDDAERLLREAIDRLPENQRLRIQLAFVLDLMQRPWDATGMIEQAEAGGVQLSTSPRVRYAEWPVVQTEKIRATLGAAETAGLDALAEAYQ